VNHERLRKTGATSPPDGGSRRQTRRVWIKGRVEATLRPLGLRFNGQRPNAPPLFVLRALDVVGDEWRPVA
jgi:hypothetical protein